MAPSVTRRTILRTGATGLLATTAGCNLGFGGTADEVGVNVENTDEVGHTVRVAIRSQATTLLDATLTVEPGRTEGASFENPNEATDADLHASLNNGQATSRTVRLGPGTGIRYITVQVASDATLQVYVTRT